MCYIWTLTLFVFSRSQNHDVGVAGIILYHLSYRKTCKNIITEFFSLTCWVGCHWGWSWDCPLPASLYSSCKKLWPPPAAHQTTPMDLWVREWESCQIRTLQFKISTMWVSLPISGLSNRLMMMRNGLRYSIRLSGLASISFCFRIFTRAYEENIK